MDRPRSPHWSGRRPPRRSLSGLDGSAQGPHRRTGLRISTTAESGTSVCRLFPSPGARWNCSFTRESESPVPKARTKEICPPVRRKLCIFLRTRHFIRCFWQGASQTLQASAPQATPSIGYHVGSTSKIPATPTCGPQVAFVWTTSPPAILEVSPLPHEIQLLHWFFGDSSCRLGQNAGSTSRG